MAVAHDTSVAASGNGTNALALPAMTTGGTDRMIIITIHTSNAATITSITGGSLTFTQIGANLSYSGNGSSSLWYAKAASALSSTVFTVNTSGFPQITAVASAYSGCDVGGTNGVNAIGASNTFSSGGTTTPTVNVTTTANNSLVVGGWGETASQSMTAGSGQTINATGSGTAFSQSAQLRQNSVTATSGTSVTMNGTLGGSSATGIYALELKELAVTSIPNKIYRAIQAVNRSAVR